ncbi:MAG TPA: isoprenylcysteine carboxylmethyltransferase family protein [Stellaceae bacterium]|nr:isoprenylcysteine carboxylmethyltransferase family protein [Stellaceae bacterium]
MTDLDRKALAGMGQLAAVMAALLFLPAGTLDYWQAWLFLAVFFGAALAVTVYLMKHDPQLLARRMKAGPLAEKGWRQKIILLLMSLGFAAGIVVPALDRRFGWSSVPASLAVAGDALFALGYLVVFFVFRANSYAAAIVDVVPGQTVVSTGPYAIVRHPMYAGAIVMFLGEPLALASWWGVVPVAAMMLVGGWRLLDEERVLTANLPGYAEYRARVRYRLLPGVW